MAPEVKAKGKKAKGAATAAATAASTTPLRKSSRISEQNAGKRKAAEDVSPVTSKKQKPEAEKAGKPVKKAEKKKAEKVVEEEEEAVAAPVKKTEKKRKADKAVEEEEAPVKKATEKAPKKQKKQKKAVEEEKEETLEETPEEAVPEEDDDTTKALVQDLDSGDEEDNGGASLFQPGQDVGKAPVAKKATPVVKTTPKAAASKGVVVANGHASDGTPGVVYIGRIPHGFFEHEMRSYFAQFGEIRRLRLSRNRRTGASKHYAFIEFADAEVAAIVAQTMDNYLLFGHILRCAIVSPDRIPPNLFAGANRRFKAVPWNRMAGRQLALPKSASQWTGKIGHENKRRAKRAALLQDKLGYAYAAPGLKSAAAALEAAEKPAESAIEAAEEPKAIEAAKTEEAAPAVAAETAVASAAPTPEKVTGKAGKAKKGKAKKSKA